MRTTYLAIIASLTLMTSAACKQTASDPPGANQSDLDKANADLAGARAKYVAAAKERIAQLDARIDELSKRADAESKDMVTKLRARRDQVAARLDTMAHQAASGWQDFKQDIDRGVDSIENDIDHALK